MLPAREGSAEHFTRHASILGRIERAVRLPDHGVEPRKQVERRLAPERKVQRERRARPREGQNAQRRQVAKGLQHREKRGLAGGGDNAQHLGDRVPLVFAGNDALILQHAASSIQPVPVMHRVERIEERRVMLAVRSRLGAVDAMIKLVEGADRKTVEGEAGRLKRNTLPTLVVVKIICAVVDPIGAGKNPAPSSGAAGRAVEPGDSVFEASRALVGQGPKVVEIVVGNDLDIEVSPANFDELQLHPFDHAGQTETADGGGEQRRIGFRRDRQRPAIAAQQPKGANMSPERARAMMILAVNVVGDDAAERDEARSRRRRRKPAFWDDETQNFRKARARFRAQYACSVEMVGASVSPGTHSRLKMSTRSSRLIPALGLEADNRASSKFRSLAGTSTVPSSPPAKATGVPVAAGGAVGTTLALVFGLVNVM